jgi:hypothetical protein
MRPFIIITLCNFRRANRTFVEIMIIRRRKQILCFYYRGGLRAGLKKNDNEGLKFHYRELH